MALDGAKKDYYTSAEGYKDDDGNTKNFTFIDHDKKTTIGFNIASAEESQRLTESIRKYIEESIEEILAMPAISCPTELFDTFVIRDVNKGVIWNEKLVRERCLADFNTRYHMKLLTWKRTIAEQHWFEDLSHEEIMAGVWKKWVKPEFLVR